MKKILLIMAIVLMPMMGVFATSEKESNKYTLAVDSTWPPMEYIDTETNEIIGFTVDLVNAIAEEESIEVELVTTAWDGIFAGLLVGDYDGIASSVTITEERKEKFDFSDPYFNAGQVLAIRKVDADKYKSLNDMVGKEVGAQIGTSGAQEVEKVNGIILKTYDALGPAAEELANGTIEGIVADNPLISDYLLKNEKYEGLFISVGEPMTSENYGFVVPKNDSQLLKIFNDGLKKVKSSGKYDEIYSKWIK